MPNIIPDPSHEFRVDITSSGKQAGRHFFTATEDTAVDTARRLVASLGGDAGDLFILDATEGASYYETVVVE